MTIDLLASPFLVLLVFCMYYQRYRDKELVTAAAMLNIFAFAVLTTLSPVELSIAADGTPGKVPAFAPTSAEADALATVPDRLGAGEVLDAEAERQLIDSSWDTVR